MTLRRGIQPWLWCVLALVSSCSKCGRSTPRGGEPVERVLPRGAVGIVMVPALGAAGQKLKILEALKVTGFVAQLQGFADGKAFADALVAQVGIDIRSPEALEKAGVDGSRSAGAAALVTGQVYLALPIKDEQKFHGALEFLSSRRLGAAAGGEQKSGELTVKTFSPHQGEPPKLGYVLSHGYALVTDGPGVAKLAALGAMTPTDCLSTDPQWTTELAKLSSERDAVVYLPTGTPLLVHAPLTSAVASVSLTSAGLSVVVNGAWKGDVGQLAAFEPQPVKTPLLGYLPRDAFLVTRFSGDPSALGPWMGEVLGPHLASAFAQGGFDLKSEVLAHVEPGLVASLSLSDRPPMDRGLPSLDIRQTNPFTYAHLSGAAAVKSPDVVAPALQKVSALAPKFGASIEMKERADGQKAWLTSWAQGEGVHFAPKGSLVFFASPVQRLEALVKSDGHSSAPVAFEGGDGLNAVVNLTTLANSVRALPESAWGLGGFAIKATTLRWLDATDDLKAISLSVGTKEKAIQARVHLTLGTAKAVP